MEYKIIIATFIATCTVLILLIGFFSSNNEDKAIIAGIISLTALATTLIISIINLINQ